MSRGGEPVEWLPSTLCTWRRAAEPVVGLQSTPRGCLFRIMYSSLWRRAGGLAAINSQRVVRLSPPLVGNIRDLDLLVGGALRPGDVTTRVSLRRRRRREEVRRRNRRRPRTLLQTGPARNVGKSERTHLGVLSRVCRLGADTGRLWLVLQPYMLSNAGR